MKLYSIFIMSRDSTT